MTSTVEFRLSATDFDATHVPLGEIITGAKVLRAGNRAYPLLSMTMHHGLVRQEDKFKKRIASRDLSQYKVVSNGQLVVGFPIDEGVLSFQMLVDAGIVSPAYGVWDLRNPDAVDRSYLEKYLRSPQAIGYYLAKLRGSTARRRSLPREVFLAMPIPLPPVEEQRRIAAILDKADKLRTSRRQAFAQLDALTQSIFHSMFGDVMTQQKIPLRDAVAPGTIVTYGIVQAGDEYPSGVPYVRTGDIRNGRIEHEGLRRTDPAIAAKFTRSRIATGDIVMSIRATVGTVALTPRELDGANLTQGTARIAPGPETEASYLIEYLRSPRIQQWIQKQVKGATFKEITLDRLRQLPVFVPSRADQLSFGHTVRAIEKLKEQHRAQLGEIDTLFASLQYQAFKGVLR